MQMPRLRRAQRRPLPKVKYPQERPPPFASSRRRHTQHHVTP